LEKSFHTGSIALCSSLYLSSYILVHHNSHHVAWKCPDFKNYKWLEAFWQLTSNWPTNPSLSTRELWPCTWDKTFRSCQSSTWL